MNTKRTRALASALAGAHGVSKEARHHAKQIVLAIDRNDPFNVGVHVADLKLLPGKITERMAQGIGEAASMGAGV